MISIEIGGAPTHAQGRFESIPHDVRKARQYPALPVRFLLVGTPNVAERLARPIQFFLLPQQRQLASPLRAATS
jgi:hypothetical protein